MGSNRAGRWWIWAVWIAGLTAVAAAGLDYAVYQSSRQRVLTAVAGLGGRASSIGGWPFGEENVIAVERGLLRRYSFTGWTREQVEKLLGPAEPPPTWDDRWNFVYHLGADRTFMPIDHEWLGFSLGDDGKAPDESEDEFKTYVAAHQRVPTYTGARWRAGIVIAAITLAFMVSFCVCSGLMRLGKASS